MYAVHYMLVPSEIIAIGLFVFGVNYLGRSATTIMAGFECSFCLGFFGLMSFTKAFPSDLHNGRVVDKPVDRRDGHTMSSSNNYDGLMIKINDGERALRQAAHFDTKPWGPAPNPALAAAGSGRLAKKRQPPRALAYFFAWRQGSLRSQSSPVRCSPAGLRSACGFRLRP